MRIHTPLFGGLPGFLPGHRSTSRAFSRLAIVKRSHHTSPPSTFMMVSRATPLRRETSAIDQPRMSITLRSRAATSWATFAPWWSSSTACGQSPASRYSAGLRLRLSPCDTAKSVAHPDLLA